VRGAGVDNLIGARHNRNVVPFLREQPFQESGAEFVVVCDQDGCGRSRRHAAAGCKSRTVKCAAICMHFLLMRSPMRVLLAFVIVTLTLPASAQVLSTKETQRIADAATVLDE